jgi:hypothetical protein
MSPAPSHRFVRAALSLGRIVPALLLCTSPAQAGEVHWKGKSFSSDSLPAELPREVGEAAAPWEAWAKKKGYRIQVSDAGDCILVAEKRDSGSEQSLALIAATIAWVDPILPPRASEPAVPDVPKPKPAVSKRLEDFDLPPPAGSVPAKPTEQPRSPHQVPVLLAAADPADYKDALGMLVAQHAWLKDWAAEIGEGAYGLVLPRPLVGAWVLNAPENEEWNPDNELVHRLAQLLVIDRAGWVPYWMQLGLAWNAELGVRGSIYCFPYRYGFVGIGEHGGWAPMLRSFYGDRPKQPPTMDELSALRRGKYEDLPAGTAWGTLRWIIAEQPKALAGLLADLDLEFRKQALEVIEDGTWRSLPNWEWPAPLQRDLLRKHLGRDVFERLGAAFRADS